MIWKEFGRLISEFGRFLVYHYEVPYSFLLNKESFHLTGPLMVLEDKAITSRIGTLHFEYYTDKAALAAELTDRAEEIQLVVSQPGYLETALPTFAFGAAQRPALGDYADGVDTLAFLLSLDSVQG